jgi:hypothetical protein
MARLGIFDRDDEFKLRLRSPRRTTTVKGLRLGRRTGQLAGRPKAVGLYLPRATGARRCPSIPICCTSSFRAASVLGKAEFSTRLPYRSNHCGSATRRTHSDATTARTFKVARSVSPTRSSRLSMRTAARTCVESVRCRPRLLRNPSARARQQGVQQHWLRLPSHQSRPDFAQHRVIKARVRQFQSQRILPVDAAPHSVGRAPIRQTFDKLEDRRQSSAGGGFSGLSSQRKEASTLHVVVDGSHGVSNTPTERPLGEGRTRDTLGCFRHLIAVLQV